MYGKIGIVYNDPFAEVYHNLGEDDAVAGILDSVAAVSQALEQLGYEVVTLALGLPLSLAESELRKLDVDAVFNLFEGFEGVLQSEATVACLMETMEICFTGCPSQALHLCEDKSLAKQVLQSWDIPTANWQVLTPSTYAGFNLSFPCIVKPLGEHASHGISANSVVGSPEALRGQLEFINQKYGRPSLVEEFLPGREFSALVLGNYNLKVFPIEEIVFALPPTQPPILTYGAKWVREDTYFTGTKTKCPADVDPELKQAIDDLALRCFVALGCRGYARMDMRQDAEGQLMVLDVNPNPDISQEGGARLQVEAAGIDYASFIDDIVSLAKEHFDSARVRV